LSQAKKTIIGSSVLVITKVLMRMIGLISTLVLARVLIPEDFGLVALSLLVLKFFDLLALTGAKQYIIQLETITEQDVNTAWTLNLLLRLVVVVLIVLLGPFVSEHFGDERLTSVLVALAGLIILDSLCNPGMMLYERDQNYVPIFRLSLVQKVLTVIVTISCALIFKNYWALIIGHLFSNSIKLIGSYVMHDHRPRFCITNIKQQWDFSKWMMSKGVIGYARSQLDTFLVSSNFSVAIVGNYHIMKYISSMPSSEIIIPATEPLLAAFSKSRNNSHQMSFRYRLCLLAIITIAIPVSSFMFVYHENIVMLLLGEQWIKYSEVFGILSLLVISGAIGSVASQALVAKNKIKYLFYYDVLSLIVMAIALLSFSGVTISQFASIRVAVDLVLLSCLFMYTSLWVINISLWKIISLILPGVISSLLSLYLISLIGYSSAYAFMELLIYGLCFFLLYSLFSILFYAVILKNTPEWDFVIEMKNSVLTYTQKKISVIQR